MKNRILNQLKKNGLLIFLFICVCIVAASTIYISIRNVREISKEDVEKDLVILEDDSLKETGNMEELEDIIGDELDMEVAITNEKELEDENVEAMAQEDDSIEEELEPEDEEEIEFVMEEIQEEREKMILPVDGKIITEFTKDTLIYSKTLDEWTGHVGIDIQGPMGAPVKAAMSGQIKQVYEDELWGIVIVIEHKDNIVSKYKNLGTGVMVKEGLEVKAGDQISTIGDSAKIEMMMEPHIHFEVVKNGKVVDPRSISH